MRGIVFDFDGVIVDSEPVHEAALRAVAERAGMSLTHEMFVRLCLGRADGPGLANLAREHGREPTAAALDEMARLKQQIFAELRDDEDGRAPAIRPYPGTLALLRAAAERGVPACICTGSRRSEVEPVLSRLGVLPLVRALVTADDVAQVKPHPEPYQQSAAKLGLAPGSCAAIEDTPTGVESARAAGLFTIAVCHTFAAEQLAAADLIVAGTDELTLERVLRQQMANGK